MTRLCVEMLSEGKPRKHGVFFFADHATLTWLYMKKEDSLLLKEKEIKKNVEQDFWTGQRNAGHDRHLE